MAKILSQKPSAIANRKWAANNPEYRKPGTSKWATKRLISWLSVANRNGYKPPDISHDKLVELYNNHNHRCDICGRPPIDKQVLALDHNHETGEVRGWLCVNCNAAMAAVDRAGIESVMEYCNAQS